ncbi:MAG TPA: hypothetical protein VIT45_09565 [Allosphingosinicella sp.]
MPDAIDFAAEKWLFFTESLVFKPEVSLRYRLRSFAIPAKQGLQNNFAALKSAPDALLFMVVAMGVWKSGTHSREEVETALGAQLPDLL